MIYRRILLAFALMATIQCECSLAQSFQWNLTHGPGVDPPSVLEIAPDNSIIVGTGRNLFRSIDGGISWQSIPVPKYLGNLVNVVVLPDTILIVRTDKPSIVRMTLDGTIEATSPIRYADIHGTPAGTILAVLDHTHLARSTDEGSSWDTIPGPTGESLAGFTSDIKNYYVSTASGIYISSDNGASWKRALNGLSTHPYYAIAAGTDGNVWATSYTGSYAMYWSGDYGVHWKEISTSSDIHYEIRTGRQGEAITLGAHLTDSLLHAIPAIAGIYAYDSTEHWLAGGSGPPDLFESAGGSPWQWNALSPPLATPSFLTRVYHTVMAGFAGSEWVIDSIGFWHKLGDANTSILGMDYYGEAILGTGGGAELLRSTDSGRNWNNIFAALPSGTVRAIAAPPHRIYAATKGIYYTDDNGNDWSETNDAVFTSPIALLCADSIGNVYAATNSQLYRTSDGGNTWQKITLPVAQTITKLEANREGTLVAIGARDTILRSPNFGMEWDLATTPDGSTITDAVILPSNDIYISSNTGVFYWDSRNVQMRSSGAGLDSIGVNALAFNDSGTLFAATAGRGVMESSGTMPAASVTQDVAMNTRTDVFPDPASNFVTVTVPPGNVNSILAVDPLGRQYSLKGTPAASGVKADVRGLRDGYYILVVSVGRKTFTARIAISR